MAGAGLSHYDLYIEMAQYGIISKVEV